MEDSHAFVYDFGDVAGQGYFGVFDGHAGKHAAEWCGQNFHTVSYRCIAIRIGMLPDLVYPDSISWTHLRQTQTQRFRTF